MEPASLATFFTIESNRVTVISIATYRLFWGQWLLTNLAICFSAVMGTRIRGSWRRCGRRKSCAVWKWEICFSAAIKQFECGRGYAAPRGLWSASERTHELWIFSFEYRLPCCRRIVPATAGERFWVCVSIRADGRGRRQDSRRDGDATLP